MRGSFYGSLHWHEGSLPPPTRHLPSRVRNRSEVCRIKKRILRDPLLVLLGTKISVKINLWRIARGVIILLYGLDGG